MTSTLTTTPEQFISVDTNVHFIDCSSAWPLLSKDEQLYAYHFARASWEGAKICTFQRSFESPGLLVLLRATFAEGPENLKGKVLSQGVTEEEWNQFLAFSAATMQNCGNYRSFGDKKFIPQISPEKFWTIVKSSEGYKKNTTEISDIWDAIKDVIYRVEPPFKVIGFRNENGLTSYYSANITKEEATKIKDFQEGLKISPLNTRLVKLGLNHYCLKLASVEKGGLPYIKSYEWEGLKIIVENGEFAPFMAKTVDHLKECLKYAANENQKNMLSDYIEHFQYGEYIFLLQQYNSIEKHKESQKHWIKDVNPTVEANIGFIETYVDPLGVRAEFEGWVAAVNKDESKKLSTLVANANNLIPQLPWPKEFEKDEFRKPDFTSLEVVAFGCSETPLGICLPNYDDVRQTCGYKNVNLGNSYPIPTEKNVRFVSAEDIGNYIKYFKDSEFLVVALHELLGHGTGKLLQESEETGKPNFPTDLKDPFTNEPITNYYKAKETYESRFGHLHSAYEECRADTVAYYLSCYDAPMNILFPGREAEWNQILGMAWLGIIVAGLKGLEHYNPEQKKWMQAHVNAAYVIMKVLLEAGEGLIKFETTKREGKDYIIGKLDQAKIKTVGKEAIGKFLKKLHILKSLGDFKRAKEFFGHYSEVDEEMLKIRNIVLMHKVPRRLELQGNLKVQENGEIKYVGYGKSFEGIIQSFVDRYDHGFDEEMYSYWKSCRNFYNPIQAIHQPLTSHYYQELA
eukprot:TRINITY_DN287_c0_g1_i1.p1 TRINITY_DN287_c0_g1~~TRINITY_DN287_c0_g1_i1.p1  ORF type:complete len:741 (+),score=95.70 TRINITY_DN287_c0_g1_i1:8973-11195(+)